jgi:gliding motility-associated-like protein
MKTSCISGQGVRIIAGFLIFIGLLAGKTAAQVPTFQDCLGAIPVCLGSYTSGNAVTGTGNIPNEINPVNSCLLTGERNDSWYIITTNSAGNLSFSVIPANPVHNYDWAVYNLTSSTCASIFTNPALEVSCNYDNTPGTTGPNGLAGPQNNPVIPVASGQTYLVNVSAFSTANQGAYTIDFSASTATVTDNTPPTVSGVNAMNCGASSMTVSFSERVLCSSVQAGDFTLTGPGGPFTITGVTSAECTAGATYSRDYTVTFSPAIPGAGVYTLTLAGSVTDLCANNATVPQPFPVPISGINISFTTVDVTCFGGNNGTATANVSGPPGPYTYQWSPMGGSGATAQWLTAGTYTVTVTSSLGCSAQASVTINQPLTGMTASVVVTPANGCAANGTATVTVSNGQPPYTYSWWPSGGNSASATGLTAGGYMVTITDANQCALNYFLNVPSASGPTVSISNFNNVSCFGGNDGSATVTVSGASGPFTYLWSPSGGNAATANGLTAGNYTVSVIIAPGCTLQAAVTIVEPPTPLSVNVISVNTSCGNNNGIIQLAPSGGVPPYVYQWSAPGFSGNNLNNLAPGTYTATVTDANGCTWQQSIDINGSTAPVPSLANHQDVSCFGLFDGATGISVTGGTAPVTCLWSSGQTTFLLNNIPAGTYTVTVTDAMGCTASLTDIVIQPALLSILQQQVQDVACFGEATGSATLTASGGSGSLTWSWNGNGSVSGTIANVSAGTYTATVTDQNGCSASLAVTISQPAAPIALQETITHTTCGNSDGSVSVTASGGTGPYNFQWSTGASGTSVSSLVPGIYTVTVTDQNNCTFAAPYVVQASDAPVISVNNVTGVLCNGGNTGAISLGVTGGLSPYNWSWQGGVSTGPSASNLPAGSYNITVTDQSGCSSYIQVTISEPAPLSVQVPQPDPICIGSSATLTGMVSGGTSPYSYSWSTGQASVAITVNPVVTTGYTLVATDSNGCMQQTGPVTVTVNPQIAASVIYPDSVCSGNEAAISVVASGGDGNFTFSWSNGLTGVSNTVTVIQNLTLTVTVTDGCTTPAVQLPVSIVALQPPVVSLSPDPQTGCEPLRATFSVPPGWPSGYVYLWNFGDGYISSNPASSHTYLEAGIYDVTLSVAYASAPGCSTTLSFPALIDVKPAPEALFFYEPTEPTINRPDVFFTDRSRHAAFWWWDFGDGSPEEREQHPKHTYQDTGVYVVTLKVQSQDGCRDSTWEAVHVRDEMQVYLPNAFTPNGTGINDAFDVYGVGFTSYEMIIYDRWGKVVHVAKNRRPAWDGTDMNSGKPVPQGVYVYKVTIIDNAGNFHHRFDYVTLIR